MMKMFHKGLLAFISFLLIFAIAGCGGAEETTLGKIKKNKSIVVGTDATFPPFEYKNDKKEYDGFDVELIQAIANEMGVKVQFVDTEFKGLIPGLQAKKFDLIVSAMYKTAEREKAIRFSDTYYPGGLAIMVKKDDSKIKGIEDLDRKEVAVQIGTKSVSFLKEKYPKVKPKEVEKNTDMFLELESGRVEAVVTGKPAAKVYAKEKGTVKVLDQLLTHEEYGYGIRKNDPELAKEVNTALKKLKENGKYDQIVKKWFGE
ncbi:polar amino acid transport system substrate-binding protein [Seinonella peptonophila]|uniref:Polar amino acid transport system substrate-binding protein n=1 Tax=Seinonella peptonophila TaxID=112248 RepID=A0A1M4U2Q7_9BACL|nr:transporter substrate-binding domain-containing protein [Seinonella peptonophila]SHE50945.1 polar amino acid transport system substrate-binding protein [Seinonella peptonophila]